MNEPTIEQINEVIAIFMGLKPVPSGAKRLGDIKHPEIPEAFLHYHSSWDWLKPVIDEIFKYALVYPIQVKPIIDMCIVVEIGAAHEKVYQFIQWYNKQKKATNG